MKFRTDFWKRTRMISKVNNKIKGTKMSVNKVVKLVRRVLSENKQKPVRKIMESSTRTKQKSVIDFLVSTKNNYNLSGTQYKLYDRVSDGLWEYANENNLDPKSPEVRKEYFTYEVESWDDDRLDTWIETFDL